MKASSRRRGLAEINESRFLRVAKWRRTPLWSAKYVRVWSDRSQSARVTSRPRPALVSAAGAWPTRELSFEAPQRRRCLQPLQPLPLPLMRARLLPVPPCRPLSDQTVFSSVAWLLRSVQEQGDCAPPRSVLRSALYLLAAAQDKSPDLDEVKLSVGPCCLSCIACMQVKRFVSATPFYV